MTATTYKIPEGIKKKLRNIFKEPKELKEQKTLHSDLA